jgi:hypothetical protein
MKRPPAGKARSFRRSSVWLMVPLLLPQVGSAARSRAHCARRTVDRQAPFRGFTPDFRVADGEPMRRRFPILALGLALAALPAAVHVLVGGHHVEFTGTMHFYSVGFSALVAATAAIGLSIVGARRGDTRTMIVGTSFAAMASASTAPATRAASATRS